MKLSSCFSVTTLAALSLLYGCDSGSVAGPSGSVAAVVVSAPRSDIRVDQTIQLAASAINGSGRVVEGSTVAWSSDNTAVATVDGTGKLTGLSAGKATITASVGDKSGTLQVAVSIAPVATIEITTPVSPVPAGVPQTLSVVARDSANRTVTGRQFSYQSSDTTVASVSSDGVLSGRKPGAALITVSSEGKSGSRLVTVVLGPPASITITGGDVYRGTSRVLAATLRDPAGNVLTMGTLEWSTSDASKVAVAPDGTITGVNGGSATISVRSSGITGTFQARTVVARFIDSGTHTTCFIDEDAITYCLGRNSNNETGSGSGAAALVDRPVRVVGGLRFTSLSVGSSHACALTSDDKAYCWGSNLRGALGDGTVVDRATPTAVSGGLRFVSISGGHDHTCALTDGGEAWCWGGVNYGPTPTKINATTSFTAISAGLSSACGIDTDKQIWCWGNNDFSQLGTGDRIGSVTPRKVAVEVDFVELDQEYANACARTASGDVWCWGSLGPAGGFPPSTSNFPVKQTGSIAMFSIAVGSGHVCGLDGGNVPYCWGILNSSGQMGIGTFGSQPVPTKVVMFGVGSATFSTISAGFANSCGITPGGVPYCWGRGEAAGRQPGDNRTSPVALANP